MRMVALRETQGGVCRVMTADLFLALVIFAFVMSVIGREWHLTYGQGALILYGAGIGAIIGSLVWGSLGAAGGLLVGCLYGHQSLQGFPFFLAALLLLVTAEMVRPLV